MLAGVVDSTRQGCALFAWLLQTSSLLKNPLLRIIIICFKVNNLSLQPDLSPIEIVKKQFLKVCVFGACVKRLFMHSKDEAYPHNRWSTRLLPST